DEKALNVNDSINTSSVVVAGSFSYFNSANTGAVLASTKPVVLVIPVTRACIFPGNLVEPWGTNCSLVSKVPVAAVKVLLAVVAVCVVKQFENTYCTLIFAGVKAVVNILE